MEKNKKNYYKNNKYYNHKESKNNEKKVTYDSLMHAKISNETTNENNDYDKLLVMKYVALSVILLTIIIVSLFLFRSMD